MAARIFDLDLPDFLGGLRKRLDSLLPDDVMVDMRIDEVERLVALVKAGRTLRERFQYQPMHLDALAAWDEAAKAPAHGGV